MSLSKALKSARSLRPAKNSAVCKAESFSATAVATNWFILVPSSCFAAPRLSLSNVEVGAGMSSFTSWFYPSYRLTRDHQFNPKPSRPEPEIPHVESNQCSGAFVEYCRLLQNRFSLPVEYEQIVV